MKDFKYIIKRIIIGTGIALALMFIKTNVFASEISPYTWNGVYWDESSGVSTLTWNVPNSPWQNHGNGVLRFTVGITKISGSSTDPLIVPRMISAYNGSTRYVCDIGTASGNNSTFVGNTYSVSCPMNLDSNGVSQILLAFMPFSTQAPTPTYRIYISPDASYEVFDSTNVNVNVNNNGTIQNDNQNTQSIINNQNSNTQSIINNQNQNTQDINDNIKEQFQDCTPKKPIYVSTINNAYIYKENNELFMRLAQSSTGQKVFIYEMPDNASYDFTFSSGTNARIGSSNYLYNDSNFIGQHLTTVSNNVFSLDTPMSFNTNEKYLYIFINNISSLSDVSVSSNGETCKNRLDTTNNNLQDINNTINNDNVDSSTGSDFFNNFQSNSHGLSGIITAPLRLINSLSSSSCSSLSIPLPFVNTSATLPCMSTIYQTYFSSFLALYQLITTGIIAYWVLIKIFGHIKGMQNPEDDRIEVLQL